MVVENMKIIEKIKEYISTHKKIVYIFTGIVVFVAVLFLILALVRRSATSQFNFSAGFLGLNINKSVYAPNERIEFGIGTLDPNGNTLCHSNLEIIVHGPEKRKIVLSTQNGKITNLCNENFNSGINPDYRSSFVPEKEGSYDVTLTNLDTKMTVKEQIIVKDNSNLGVSIKRTGPTRVNPFATDRYPMILTVTSQRDFKGQLVDQLLSSFGILWQGPSEIKTAENSKTITWNVDLKAGETKEFIYEFQAPKVSPKFYNMGKASLFENNNTVLKESRSWEIIVGGNSK